MERIPQWILRGQQLGAVGPRGIVELAAVDDALAPQHRLITETGGAEKKPTAQLEMLKDQRRRPPAAFGRFWRRAVGGLRLAAIARLIRPATLVAIQTEKQQQLAPQTLARAAQVVKLAGV